MDEGENYGFELLGDVFPIFANYMVIGKSEFLTKTDYKGTTFLQMLFNIIAKCLENEDITTDETHHVNALILVGFF